MGRGPPIVTESGGLAGMFGGVIGLRLRHVALGVLHELSLGRLVAEAVGLTVNVGVDRTVRLDGLAHSKALRAHVVELAGHSQSRCG
jgi:hypothetical protein